MLQLSLVCERWPLGGIGRIKSGIAALVLSWAIGTGAYFLLASLSYLPAPQRATAGLHNPGGPSCDGGLEEFFEFCPARAARSATWA